MLTIENDRSGLEPAEGFDNEQRSAAAGGYVPSSNSGIDETNRQTAEEQEQILANEEANDVILADELAHGYDKEENKMARTHNKAAATNRS